MAMHKPLRSGEPGKDLMPGNLTLLYKPGQPREVNRAGRHMHGTISMPDNEPDGHDIPDSGAGFVDRDVLQSQAPAAFTLEKLIDITGELEHLNELVMIHLGREGGFTGRQSYFAIVTPVLDNLETAIREQYRPGMDHSEIKLLIRDWIDREIAGLR